MGVKYRSDPKISHPWILGESCILVWGSLDGSCVFLSLSYSKSNNNNNNKKCGLFPPVERENDETPGEPLIFVNTAAIVDRK